VRSVVIVGGGWAGLAVAYHLLDRKKAPRVVIIDEKAPGEGGASAAAAGDAEFV
jgi:glycine/D-amino acid oxidase-like deaminating enzyme